MTIKTLGALLAGTVLALVCHGSFAASAADLSRDANAALKKLYATVPAAKACCCRTGFPTNCFPTARH